MYRMTDFKMHNFMDKKLVTSLDNELAFSDPLAMEVFSKFLSQSDTTVRLSVPTRALPDLHYFEGSDLPVTDWNGGEWLFRFSTRRQGHPRPVFTGGWLGFSRAMRLQARDWLTLYQLEDGKYRIDIYGRPISKFLVRKLSGFAWIIVKLRLKSH